MESLEHDFDFLLFAVNRVKDSNPANLTNLHYFILIHVPTASLSCPKSLSQCRFSLCNSAFFKGYIRGFFTSIALLLKRFLHYSFLYTSLPLRYCTLRPFSQSRFAFCNSAFIKRYIRGFYTFLASLVKRFLHYSYF